MFSRNNLYSCHATHISFFWFYSTLHFSKLAVLAEEMEIEKISGNDEAAAVTTNVKDTKSSCDQSCALSPSFLPFPRKLEKKLVMKLSKIFVLPGFDIFHLLGFLWNTTKLLFKKWDFNKYRIYYYLCNKQ